MAYTPLSPPSTASTTSANATSTTGTVATATASGATGYGASTNANAEGRDTKHNGAVITRRGAKIPRNDAHWSKSHEFWFLPTSN